jgi:1,4-alpha-glucan branching enzyme
MNVRPGLLFLYWVLDRRLLAEIAGLPGPAGLILEASADGVTFSEIDRRTLDFRAPSWYVTHEVGEGFVRVRLGTGTGPGGAFRTILTSDAVRAPRTRPGSAPEKWAEPPPRRRGGAARAAARIAASDGRPEPPPVAVAGEGAPEMARPVAATVPPAAAPATSPGSANVFVPGTREAAAAPAPERADGDLCLVLHSHLPFVRHPERDYFLEENWLFEAITETYLPILDMLDHLLADAVPVRVTMSLTPTLMAMLRDPLLLERYDRHLRRTDELAGLEVERTRRDPDFGPVAGFYRDRIGRLLWLFEKRYGRDLVGRFAHLQEEGAVELIACAATHGLLPNLAAVEGSARAQVAVGVAEHRRQIGRDPRGIWLPECAYFEGLDRILADEGLEFFFVDAHAVRNAGSPPRLDLHAPLLCPSGVAAFGRDEECSAQVWSAELGYPGDPDYRDFYRDIGFDLDEAYVGPFLDPAGTRHMTGLKYHRITGRHDRKEPYRRVQSLRALDRHAEDFVRNRAVQARRLAGRLQRRPLMVAMYDSELFGHWWFEGVDWLEAVLRRLPDHGIRAITPGDYLDARPRLQVAEPAASSWGEGGYFEVWLRDTTDWIYPPLHDAARRLRALAGRRIPAGRRGHAGRGLHAIERRALSQAARELLLAQASDWPFIIKNGTAVEYARRRVADHLARFDRLARQIEDGRVDPAYLAALEARDNLFPDLDPRAWSAA